MTQLVVDAERRGELPPTRFSPRELQQQHPTLSELRAAFSLHRLSRALAICICNEGLTCPRDREEGPLPEEPARMPEWRSRVSQTLFWLLTVGAALAGAYKEPLLAALSHPDPTSERSRGEGQGEGGLGQKKMAFLLQLAVCDLSATLEAQDAVFGPVADWLLDSILSDHEARWAMADRFNKACGRARYCHHQAEAEDEDMERYPCPLSLLADGHRGRSHSDAHLVVWELMMFWLVEQIRPYPLTESMLDRQAPRHLPRHVGADESDSPRGPVESAVAVFFGMFRAEETRLPTTLADGSGLDWWLIAYPAVPAEAYPEEEEVEEEEEEGGGEPRRRNKDAPDAPEKHEQPVAPLEFKFFEYFLRRHLGLCLNANAVRKDEIEYMNRSYQEFTETVAIFSHDNVEKSIRSYRNGHMLKDNGETRRRAYGSGSGSTLNADFLDGSEMLTRYPPYFTHFYQPKREW
ncbi:hypothetical protein C8A05DRAFT_34320 [Staphylotrichum tortipilum]|uniref:Uncharacterized protein n=1 Tax=Staphylotrichum tortipilum TaxID=2831512 RepID=A0AAN6RT37_9PEZI|nr:hypothetical protein C8A05DRAFT_34320 [Staphylotrichum longicolle]